MIVVDASVVVYALGDDGAVGDRTRARLHGEKLIAPEVLDLEVISAWRRAARAGRFEEGRAQHALTDLDQLSLVRVPHRLLMPRIWGLRDNLSSYDAAYVALAELLDTPLLTADKRVGRVRNLRCAIEVLR